MSLNTKYYSEDINTIERVDFTILTNTDVKKYSAVKKDPFGINVADSYDNYEPKKGGLVDLRLGTCDIYLNCTTCGLNSLECPGHFGHTELASPVFHFGFMNHLKTILQCICLQCVNVLVEKNKELIEKLTLKKEKHRLKELRELTKNINFCHHCGCPVPTITKELKENSATAKILIEREVGAMIVDEKTGDSNETKKKIKEYYSAQKIYNLLRNVSETDCFLLGFNPKISRPEDLICIRFPIPPINIRPTAKIDFQASSTMEDSLTLKIADIISNNNRIRNQNDKAMMESDVNSYKQDIYTLLQYHVITYFDNETVSLPKSEFKSSSKPTKSISERIKGKAGRVRSNLMGKRVDFSARSVITSDPYIGIDEVGIPKRVAMDLTIPEEVTPNNIKNLSKLVKNGREKYPGANYVHRINFIDGTPINQRIDLLYRKKDITLVYGDIVDRHIINGDYVLFNRQPTLHKPSMMGHKIQVLDRDDADTFRVNVSVCGPYNADFDGDEMNIHLAQSIQARNEIARIADVKYNIISAKDSNPIIGCVQDSLMGAYILTDVLDELNMKIDYNTVCNILCGTTSMNKFMADKGKSMTGHELFSHIIPKGINSIKKNENGDINFQIKNGVLLQGTLEKSSLSTKANSIIHFIWDKYGPELTRNFIDDTQKLIIEFLMYNGMTIGFKDCIIGKELTNKFFEIAKNKIIESKYHITKMENDINEINLDIIESSISGDLNNVRYLIGGNLLKHVTNENNFYKSLKSGSKAKPDNLFQIMGVWGQNNIMGGRMRKTVENRTLPHFHRDDDTPEARGFIFNNLVTGLNGHEFFFHTASGREGLIATAIKSVSWETPIVIIENNKPTYTKIGRWIDKHLKMNSSKIKYESQLNMELLDLSTETFIPTTDYKGNVSWGKVSAVTRHDPGDKLFEIKTLSGRKVIVTASKSLLIWNENTHEFKEKLTEEIVIGDKMPVTETLPKPPILLSSINIKDYITIPLKFLKRNINETFQLNYTNGIFIGLYLAKGTILKNYIKITNVNKNIQNFIKKWFTDNNIHFSESNKNKKQPFLITGYSYILTTFLIKFVGKYNMNKIIPSVAFTASNNFIKGLLNGYFSANGCVTKNSIDITSTSKRLLEGLSMLCNRLGIFCNTELYKLKIYAPWAIKFSNIINLLEKSFSKQIKNIKWNNVNCKTLNNVVLDSVVEINMIDTHNHPKMYDLTIPSTFNFGLANGLMVRDTAETGYIQRRLVKALEDMNVRYDGTVRNSNDLIIQYVYGENGINQLTQTSIKLNIINYNNMIIEEKLGFNTKQIKELETNLKDKNISKINKEHINKLILFRDELRKIQRVSTLNYKTITDKYMIPVNLNRLTYDFIQDKIDKYNLHPQYIIEKIDSIIKNFNNKLIIYTKQNSKLFKEDEHNFKFLFKIALYEYISPVRCIYEYKLNKEKFDLLIEEIEHSYIKSIVDPGEMVGVIAAQSIGEPTSQMNLDSKHSAGKGGDTTGALTGVPRIKEIIGYSKSMKTPQTIIYFNNMISEDKSKVNRIASFFKHLTISELIDSAEILFQVNNTDDNMIDSIIKDDNMINPFYINNMKVDIKNMPFIFRLKLNLEKMMDKETTILDIKTRFISYWYNTVTNSKKTMKRNEKDIFTRITRMAILGSSESNKDQIIHIRFSMSSFDYTTLTEFLKIVLDTIPLKGINNINGTRIDSERNVVFDDMGNENIIKENVVTTAGINIEDFKKFKGIDFVRTRCNDIATTYRLYGIEAARNIILYELNSTFNEGGSNGVNFNHLSLLVDFMTHSGDITSIDRHGLSKLDIDPMSKASFEKTMEHFVNAAIFNESDKLTSVSSKVMMGQVIPGGTGSFSLKMDTDKLINSEYTTDETGGRSEFVSIEPEPLLVDILKYGINETNFFIPSEVY